MFMKNKINVAEILKDCPSGIELNCTMYEHVYFDYVDELGDIHCYIKLEDKPFAYVTFLKNGCHNIIITAKCVIFPKGKTTWEGFVPPCKFKDGDIVATNTGNWIGITAGGISDEEIPTYCIIDPCNNLRTYFDKLKSWNFSRLATEEEKAKLFQAIKDNGYHWNTETKTLEKLTEPKFKVGERVFWKYSTKNLYTIVNRRFVPKIGYVYWIECEYCRSGWWEENELIPTNNNFETFRDE